MTWLTLTMALLALPGRCVERAVLWAEPEKCSSWLSQLEHHTLNIYQCIRWVLDGYIMTRKYMRPQQRSFIPFRQICTGCTLRQAGTQVPTWSAVCLVCTLFVKTKCLVVLCLLGIQGVTSMTSPP